MSRVKVAVAGFGVTAFGRVVSYVAQLAATMVLARLVSVEAFGVVAICSAIVALGNVLSNAGLGPALVQRRDLLQRHRDTAGTVTRILAAILFGTALLASGWVAGFFDLGESILVYQIMCAAIPLGALAAVPVGLLQRDLRFRILAGAEILSLLIGYVLPSLTIALMGGGVWALVAGMVGQASVKLATVTFFARRHCSLEVWHFRADLKSARELASFGIGYCVGAIASFGSLQGDSLVVGRQFDQASVGLYSRAYQLIALPANLIGYAMDTVLFPMLSALQDRRDHLAGVYFAGLSLMSIIFMPLSVLLAMTAEELVLVVLGGAWADAVVLVVILSGFTFFRMAYKLTDALTRAIGVVNQRAVLKIVYAMCVVSGAMLGSQYGLPVVACLVGVAIFLNYVLMNFLVFRYVRFDSRDFFAAHLRGLVTASLITVPLVGADYLFGNLLNLNIFWSLLAVWAVFGVVLSCLIMAFPVLTLGRNALGLVIDAIPTGGFFGRIGHVLGRSA